MQPNDFCGICTQDLGDRYDAEMVRRRMVRRQYLLALGEQIYAMMLESHHPGYEITPEEAADEIISIGINLDGVNDRAASEAMEYSRYFASHITGNKVTYSIRPSHDHRIDMQSKKYADMAARIVSMRHK